MRRSKSLLLAGLAMTIAISVAAVAYFFVFRDKNDPVAPTDFAAQEEAINADIARKQSETTAIKDQLLGEVSSVDELKALNNEDQALVAVELAQQSIAAGDTVKSSAYIEYIMSKNDNDAIEASKLCYQTAADDQGRLYCRNRAIEILRAQGLLAPGQQLPANFFEPVEEKG